MVLIGVFAPTASGAIIKDQVSSSSLWNGQATYNHGVIGAGSDRINYSVFQGNGERLSTVGFIIDIRDGSGNANGPLNAFSLRLGFYSDITQIAGDQLRQTALFGAPSNANWQNIIGQSADGSALRYVEVDVSSLNIFTTSGAMQALYLLPAGLGPSGSNGYRIPYSTGGAGAIGKWEDMYRSRLTGQPFEVRTFTNWGMPLTQGAYRITTVPEPGVAALLGLSGLTALRRRRR